jgi:hypothetical protein
MRKLQQENLVIRIPRESELRPLIPPIAPCAPGRSANDFLTHLLSLARPIRTDAPEATSFLFIRRREVIVTESDAREWGRRQAARAPTWSEEKWRRVGRIFGVDLVVPNDATRAQDAEGLKDAA